MWEDFMRGNWPVAAVDAPAESSPRHAAEETAGSSRNVAASGVIAGLGAERVAQVRAERPRHARRATARLAIAFGET